MKRYKIYFFLIYLLFLFVFAVNAHANVFVSVEERAEKMVVSIGATVYSLIGKVNGFFFSITSCWQGDNVVLDQKDVMIASLSAQLSSLERENKILKRQLRVSSQIGFPKVMAVPIAFSRYLVIDKGEKDGVKTGDIVVIGDVLLGKIVSSKLHSSSVMLVSDVDFKAPAWTSQLTRGIVRGEFGNAIVFDEVLQGDSLKDGDLVLTTGEEGFVQNLLIGRVKEVKAEPRDVYKRAVLDSFINMRKITKVFILSVPDEN